MNIAERPDSYNRVDPDRLLKKLTEIKLQGFYSRPCPECGGELTRVEPDATSTWCEGCGETVDIEPLF